MKSKKTPKTSKKFSNNSNIPRLQQKIPKHDKTFVTLGIFCDAWRKKLYFLGILIFQRRF
jgi:hypothetical protein